MSVLSQNGICLGGAFHGQVYKSDHDQLHRTVPGVGEQREVHIYKKVWLDSDMGDWYVWVWSNQKAVTQTSLSSKQSFDVS